jgi:flavin-binding protein dodecin
MSVAKIVEIVGSSNEGWEDAAQNAVNEAAKTIREIHGIEIKDMTATNFFSRAHCTSPYVVCHIQMSAGTWSVTLILS